MLNVSIYQKSWIDLVFEGKNQQYGAYMLRKENPKTTLLSFIYGILFVGGFIVLFAIFNLKSNVAVAIPTDVIDETIKITPVSIPETKTEPIKPSLSVEKKVAPQVTPSNLTKIVVAKTAVSVDVPTIQNTAILQPAVNSGLGAEILNGINQNTTSTVEATTGSETKNSYISVELDKLPEFPNGIEKFYQYIAKNFKIPDLEEGQILTVLVSFIIEKDGSMNHIKILRNPGYEIDKEAIRVLQTLKTKWKPGIKNGNPVRTEYSLPIKVKIN